MADVRSFERLRSWGWMVMVVTVIAFLVVLGLSLVFSSGINGLSTLPIISITLVGLAIVFVGGFLIETYGRTRIWLRRRAASQASAERRARRTQA
ncbi:MAG: hypothetical protein QXS27_05450 [Candidatus Jordarchaeaceae archaeon]